MTGAATQNLRGSRVEGLIRGTTMSEGLRSHVIVSSIDMSKYSGFNIRSLTRGINDQLEVVQLMLCVLLRQ